MKRNSILILAFALVACAIAGLWKLNKDFLLLWNVNSLTVTTDTSLSNK